MSANSGIATSPSTPVGGGGHAEPARPGPGRRSPGRCRPSPPSAASRDSRSTLIIRSVPMLPDPITATLVVHRATLPPPRRTRDRDRAEAGDPRLVRRARRSTGTIGPSAPDSTTSPARSGSPAAASVRGQPGQRVQRVAEAGGAGADRDRLAGVFSTIRTSRRSTSASGGRGAQHEQAAGGVVGDGVDDGDVPVGDAAVDDLDAPAAGSSTAPRTRRRSSTSLVGRSAPSTNATSASTFGCSSRPAGTSAPSGTAMSASSTPKSGWSTPSCRCTASRGQADLRAHAAPAGRQPLRDRVRCTWYAAARSPTGRCCPRSGAQGSRRW